jgi:hypothetical protein
MYSNALILTPATAGLNRGLGLYFMNFGQNGCPITINIKWPIADFSRYLMEKRLINESEIQQLSSCPALTIVAYYVRKS